MRARSKVGDISISDLSMSSSYRDMCLTNIRPPMIRQSDIERRGLRSANQATRRFKIPKAKFEDRVLSMTFDDDLNNWGAVSKCLFGVSSNRD